VSGPAARSTVRRAALAGGVALAAAGLGAGLAWYRLAPAPAADDAVALLMSQSLPDADGVPLAFARFAGRPLVVNFWATWCPPCVEEMPELSDLHAQLSARGLQMVGIGIDTADKIRSFSRKTPVSYPLVVAGMAGTELVRRFGNSTGALPFTVIVDARGRIAQRVLGRVDIGRLKAAAESLLG